MFRFRRVYVIVALAILAAFTSFAYAQGDEAIIKDAKEYASAMGVDLDEAIRRLQLQGDIGGFEPRISGKGRGYFRRALDSGQSPP